MHTTAITHLRENISTELKRVVDSREPTVVTRRSEEAVIMLPISEWNSLNETIHLLSTPANARRLMESVAQIKSGQSKRRETLVNGKSESEE